MVNNDATPRRKPPSKQRDGRAPISDNPASPRMGEKAIGPKRRGGRILYMSDSPENEETGDNLMEPAPKRRSRAKPKQQGEQVSDTVHEAVAGDVPGYVRLRVRMEDGELQLRSAKFVEGPLQRDEPVSAGLTYEANIGRKRVAHGDIPDATEWRSHPDPEGRIGLEGHHVVEQHGAEFNVRIPSEDVDEASIENLDVTVYRWQGEGPGDSLGIAELSKAPKAAVETVATLHGLAINELPKRLGRDLRTAVKGGV